MAQIGKRYPAANFITAVPAGASESGTINLPAGAYYLYVFGTQTAATTDPTLLVEAYTNAAQSATSPLSGALLTDSATAQAAMDLEVAQTSIYGVLGTIASSTGLVTPVYVPYGLKYTYTKNGGTAVDLTLVAVPAHRAAA